MHEHGLAKDLWPQLKQIADARDLGQIKHMELIVGMLYGVSAEVLIHSFIHAFQGTSFEGAQVLITIVEPGQEFIPPNSSQPTAAHGWELLVVRLDDEE
jgi:Zn finger protein HypA/HybF involved in hydrogenase expression